MNRLSISRVGSSLFVIVLSGIITAAFGYQVFTHQQPCPLCFLQRAAMIGIAAGQLLNMRFGIRMHHHALSLFNCIVGGAVSLRQISLHICPGFPVFGTPVLGFGLYTWAFIAFVCSLIAIGLLMVLYQPKWSLEKAPTPLWIEKCAFFYLVLIVFLDILAALYLCGIKICPDTP